MPDQPAPTSDAQQRILRHLSDVTLDARALRYAARFSVRTSLSSRAIGPFPSWTLLAEQESPSRTSFTLRAFEKRSDGGVTLLRFVVHDGRAFYTFDGVRWGFLHRRMSEWSGLLPRLIGGAHRGLVDLRCDSHGDDEARVVSVVRGRIDEPHAPELLSLFEVACGGGLERELGAVAIENGHLTVEAPVDDPSQCTATLSFRAALPPYHPGSPLHRLQQQFYLGFGRPEVTYTVAFSLVAGPDECAVHPPDVDATMPRVESLVDAMVARIHGSITAGPRRTSAIRAAGEPRGLDLGGLTVRHAAGGHLDLPPLGSDDFGRV